MTSEPCPLYPQKRTSKLPWYIQRSSSGSLAMFTAIRRVSFLLSSLADSAQRLKHNIK
jgi:hypothetical protein